METVALNNGLQIPILGLGIYQLHGKDCEQCVLDAVELGYRLFDTAQMYGNERELGNAIHKSGIPREDFFLTSKIYSPNTSYARAKASISATLDTMQTDYLDLLLIHEPYQQSSEIYRAMREAYQNGQIKAIGVSNFNRSFYLDFIRSCEVIPAVNQVESHVFFQQASLQECLRSHGTVMEAWSPFAAGKNGFFRNQTLREIGNRHEKTAAQIALRFLVQRGIVVIPKSSHRSRMTENIQIFDFQLSQDDMDRIAALDENKSLFGWYS